MWGGWSLGPASPTSIDESWSSKPGEVLRGDSLVYEEHASPQGGCDLTVNSLKLQVNSQDEEKKRMARLCAEPQEVSYFRRRETLK